MIVADLPDPSTAGHRCRQPAEQGALSFWRLPRLGQIVRRSRRMAPPCFPSWRDGRLALRLPLRDVRQRAAAASSDRLPTPTFFSRLATWNLAVFSLIDSVWAMALFRAPDTTSS